MSNRSRLTKKSEKKVKKRLILSILGIIVILFLLVKVGIPLLINFSLFLASQKGNGNNPTTSTDAVLIPPSLSIPYTATNSATITVNGSATPKVLVELFVNDSSTDSTHAKDDGTFTFTGVNLTQSQNTIKARTKINDKTSQFSDTFTILYIQKAPSLSVDSPSDGQSFSGGQNTVSVTGKTDPDVHVTVNGFWATVDASGKYTYSLQLQNGDNHVSVIATDAAGNTTEKDITVKYSQ